VQKEKQAAEHETAPDFVTNFETEDFNKE